MTAVAIELRDKVYPWSALDFLLMYLPSGIACAVPIHDCIRFVYLPFHEQRFPDIDVYYDYTIRAIIRSLAITRSLLASSAFDAYEEKCDG